MNAPTLNCPHCKAEIGPKYEILPRTERLRPNEFLLRSARGTVIRVRVTTTKQSQVQDGGGGAGQWNFKIQMSECVDESGDVFRDAFGNNTIFEGGVHTIRIDGLDTDLTSGRPVPSLNGILGQRVFQLAEKIEDAITFRKMSEQTFFYEAPVSARELEKQRVQVEADKAEADRLKREAEQAAYQAAEDRKEAERILREAKETEARARAALEGGDAPG